MIAGIGVAATIFIGAVLMVSGTLKAGHSRDLWITMQRFQLPLWLTKTAFWPKWFPALEIALGTVLLVTPEPVFLAPAAGGVLLMAIFTIIVTRVVRSKMKVSCNCFGGYSTEAVSGRTVARNVALTAIALAALAIGRAPMTVLADRVGLAVAFVPVILAACAALGLRYGEKVRERRATARLIATLTVQDVHGNELPITEFQDPATVLVFFSPGCGGCQGLVPRFRWWPDALPDDLDLQPVFIGSQEQFASQEAFAPLVEHAWYDPQRELTNAVHLQGTPGAVRIDSAHPLGDGAAIGTVAIEELVVRPGFWDEPQQAALTHQQNGSAE